MVVSRATRPERTHSMRRCLPGCVGGNAGKSTTERQTLQAWCWRRVSSWLPLSCSCSRCRILRLDSGGGLDKHDHVRGIHTQRPGTQCVQIHAQEQAHMARVGDNHSDLTRRIVVDERAGPWRRHAGCYSTLVVTSPGFCTLPISIACHLGRDTCPSSLALLRLQSAAGTGSRRE